MRVSLRDRFRSSTALAATEDPLVRLGAAYHLSRQPDSEMVRQQLLRLLESQDQNKLLSNHIETIVFSLHTAILLAQRNNFEGVEWILRLLQSTASRDIATLAETALRNCSQFPMAVLLTQVIEFGTPESFEKTKPLMRVSEDHLFAVSQKIDEEQNKNLAALNRTIDSLGSLTWRSGREIAIGTVLSRPALKDFGYRYTGFLSVDRESRPPLIVPYDLADLLNREDRHVRQNPAQLLRQPGRRALVVYDIAGEHEAQVLYLLPFSPAPASEMNDLLAKLAIGAEGLDVAVVVERWRDGNGDKYRLLTANGRALVRRYRAEDQEVGNCFFLHKLNGDKPLSTRFRLSAQDVEQVVHRFAEQTELDLAVCVSVDQRNGRYLLVTSGGETFFRQGNPSAKSLYAVEENQRGQFPFRLPGEWPAEVRTRVLTRFLELQPEAFGVVLEMGEGDDRKPLARIVQSKSGITFRQPTDTKLVPGTLAILRERDDERLVATLLGNYRIERGCNNCFGSEFRICAICDGHGVTVCSACDGTRAIDCPDCEEGKVDCGKCGGSGTYYLECTKCTNGYWRDGRTCPKCEGSGQFGVGCRSCNETGKWNCGTCHGRATVRCDCRYGKETCYECGGNRVSRCSCNGQRRGTVVEIA